MGNAVLWWISPSQVLPCCSEPGFGAGASSVTSMVLYEQQRKAVH